MQRLDQDNEHVKANFKGDPNIGLYGLMTDSYALVPPEFTVEINGLDIVEMTVAGTPLLGLFMAGNSNKLLVPEIVEDYEKDKLKQAGIPFTVLKSEYTALGNMILANSKGCLVSENLSEKVEKLSDELEVQIEIIEVAGLDIPGSAGVANDKGVLLHRDSSEAELKKAEKVLGVEGDIGSVNFGSPYVGTGVIANSEYLVVGDSTKGPELGRISTALDLLD